MKQASVHDFPNIEECKLFEGTKCDKCRVCESEMEKWLISKGVRRMNTGNTYYFIDDFNKICKCENGMKSDESIVLETYELIDDVNRLVEENEQLKSDKEHLMGCLIRFFGYDDEDIDYNLNRESNREYGKQYYSMKEETKKGLVE